MITPIKKLQLHQCNSWYASDTGIDIAAPVGTGIRAVADGNIIYSEFGHTPWNKPPDTPGSILIELDIPQNINGTVYQYVWYTHLKKLVYNIPDGGVPKHIKMGEYLGNTGLGNNNAHLHFGILTDRSQDEGTYMLPNQVAEYMKKLIKLGKNK